MKKYGIRAIFSTAYYDNLQEVEQKAKERIQTIIALKGNAKIDFANERLFTGFKLDYNYKAIEC